MFNLDLTSSGGFTGSVTLTCNGALLPGTCTVTPADRARSTDCCAPGFDSYRVRDGFYVCAIQAAAALALFGLLMLALVCGSVAGVEYLLADCDRNFGRSNAHAASHADREYGLTLRSRRGLKNFHCDFAGLGADRGERD
jgi:hypothetical protein